MAFARARPQSVDARSCLAGGQKAASACLPESRDESGDFRDHAIADRKDVAQVQVFRLKHRREFLAVAATGRRWITPAFVLQIGPCRAEQDRIGVGFTATKRLGNAVTRNRAKRRLREAARLLLPLPAFAGHDYVLVARAGVLTCAFQTLLSDLETAFSRVRGAKPRQARPGRARGRT